MASSYLLINYAVPFPKSQEGFSATSVSSATLQTGSVGNATATNGLLDVLKDYANRAIGVSTTAAERASEVDAGVEYRMVGCLDTTGQRFAVLMNVLYLFPLTYLFAQFFIRSYISRKTPGKSLPEPMQAAEVAGMKAFKGVTREMHKNMKDVNDR